MLFLESHEVQHTELKQTYVGATVKLICRTYSNVSWISYKKPLPPNFKVLEILYEGEFITTLIISKVSHADAGVYFCYGSDVKELQVICKLCLPSLGIVVVINYSHYK